MGNAESSSENLSSDYIRGGYDPEVAHMFAEHFRSEVAYSAVEKNSVFGSAVPLQRDSMSPIKYDAEVKAVECPFGTGAVLKSSGQHLAPAIMWWWTSSILAPWFTSVLPPSWISCALPESETIEIYEEYATHAAPEIYDRSVALEIQLGFMV